MPRVIGAEEWDVIERGLTSIAELEAIVGDYLQQAGVTLFAHYAEFAAYLVPDNPAFATAAGFACRGCAWYERAMVWYQRGYQLAVRCKNRREVIRG